jgi:hypothetical protein
MAFCLLPSTFCLGQGTAFTYQGRLNVGPNPANGLYDLQFGLFDAITNGTQQGVYITNSATTVSNGLFTVSLDFSNQFPGAARWLEISVRTNGNGAFATLAQRQALTSTPYSIQSANAASANSVAAGNITGTLTPVQLPSGIVTNGASGVSISGTFTGNGSGLTHLDASQLISIGNTTGGSNNFFVGPSGNFITGGVGNTAYGAGAFAVNVGGSYNIALGYLAGAGTFTGSSNIDIGNLGLNTDSNIIRIGDSQAQAYIAGVIHGNGSGLTNLDASKLTSIGLGLGNFFVGPSGNATSTGNFNTATGVGALGSNTHGSNNTAFGLQALGQNTDGYFNTAYGFDALAQNTTGAGNIAVGGAAGLNNTTGNNNIYIGNAGFPTDNSVIRIGGTQTQTFIAGILTGDGSGLTKVSPAQLTSIGNNTGTGNFFVGPVCGNASTSGSYNTADGYGAFLANTSGSYNTANGGGALGNNTSGSYNTANGASALAFNTNGSYNIALGYNAGANTTGSSNIDIGNPGLATDTNIIRIGSGQTQTFIAGIINGDGSGLANISGAQLTSIGNTIGTGNFFVGPSGNATTSGSYNAGIGSMALGLDTSGSYNTGFGAGALGQNQSGSYNIALGYFAGYGVYGSSNIDIGNNGLATDTNIIRIGFGQTQTYIAGIINGNGGGLTNLPNVALRNGGNTFTGDQLITNGSVGIGTTSPQKLLQVGDTTIPGSEGMIHLASRTSSGNVSARDWDFGVPQTGDDASGIGYSFVIRDLTTATNVQFMVKWGSGNVGIGCTNPIALLTVGNALSPAYCDGTTWVNGSDRNAKEDFSSVDAQEVLAKVAALPLTEWQYKATPGQAHLGPMAQDFHAAFGLNGNDDKHIATVDESGVALAAIQGLNEKLESQNQKLEAENAQLKLRLDKLEQLIDSKRGN